MKPSGHHILRGIVTNGAVSAFARPRTGSAVITMSIMDAAVERPGIKVGTPGRPAVKPGGVMVGAR